MNLDTFTRAYIEAALWSSTGEPFGTCAKCEAENKVLYWNTKTMTHELCYACSGDSRGHSPYEPPLDANYSINDIAPETLAVMVADCAKFKAENDIEGYGDNESQAGHDFWLTRNGHGCGFWEEDHGTPEQCAKLDAAAKAFGSFDLYVGDDGLIYGS